MSWDSFYSVHILSLHRSLVSNHVTANYHVITLFVYWKKSACFTAAGFASNPPSTPFLSPWCDHQQFFCYFPPFCGQAANNCSITLWFSWPVFFCFIPPFCMGRQQKIVYLLYDSLVFYCFQLLYYISLSFK